MSNVQALLAKCRELGVHLTPSADGGLKFRSPVPLPDNLKDELKQRKAEILAALQSSHEGEQVSQPNELPADLPILDAWLCDQHPGLWHQIRAIDDILSTAALTPADYQQKLATLLQLYQQARDVKAGRWGALLIRSDVLGGEEVWVMKDEEQAYALQTDGKAIYFAEEFALLKTKTPEQIQDIHQAKLAFPGCRVVQ